MTHYLKQLSKRLGLPWIALGFGILVLIALGGIFILTLSGTLDKKGASPLKPAFPWPPPRASAETMIPHNWLPTRGAARLGDVADRLENALRVAKYPRWSYSSLSGENGFALVSQMEQIKADGTPGPDPARWSTKLPQVDELTLLEFIRALANAQPGYYRVIVFIVTNKPWPRKPETPTGVEAKKWFDYGFSWLPQSIAELPYGPDYRTTALVYEFKKVSQNTDATFLDPSATSADDHLRKAGISGPLSH